MKTDFCPRRKVIYSSRMFFMLLTIHVRKHGSKGNRIVLQHDGGYSLINNLITVLGMENMKAGKKNFL